MTSTPTTVRRRPKRRGAALASSRRAATGGTLVALSAGTREEIRVIPMPTTSETITVRGRNCRLVVGSLPPNASSRRRRPMATTTPKPSPTSEAITPTTVDSSSTEPSTWRRLAPRQRSSASSRVRWASTMVKVLTIRNAPTSRATPAKASRAVPRKRPIVSEMLLALASAYSCLVRTS